MLAFRVGVSWKNSFNRVNWPQSTHRPASLYLSVCLLKTIIFVVSNVLFGVEAMQFLTCGLSENDMRKATAAGRYSEV